jgi:hypothetical protein
MGRREIAEAAGIAYGVGQRRTLRVKFWVVGLIDLFSFKAIFWVCRLPMTCRSFGMGLE